MSEHRVIPIGSLGWFMGWAPLVDAHFLVFTAVAHKRIEI